VDLRSALSSKRGNETSFDLLISDPSDAEQALQQAQADLRLAEMRGAETDELKAAQQAAEDALQACYYRLRFRNMPAHEFEALVGEHEASKEEAEKGEVWDREGLTPALLAACTVDSDLTAEEWAAELASERWNAADKLGVYRAALDANIKQRSSVLPKG
jgi:HEPN domain-containing protein